MKSTCHTQQALRADTCTTSGESPRFLDLSLEYSRRVLLILDSPTNLRSYWIRSNGKGFVSKSAKFRPVPIFTILTRPSSRLFEASGASCASDLPAQIFVELCGRRLLGCCMRWSPSREVRFEVRSPPQQLSPQRRFPTTIEKWSSVASTRISSARHCGRPFRHSLIACPLEMPSVYAMMRSECISSLQCVHVVGLPSKNRTTLLSLTMSPSFGHGARLPKIDAA